MSSKKFYYINVPIGNWDDFTLRAIQTIRELRVLVCEEIKPARRLLKHLGVNFYEGNFDPTEPRLFLFPVNENTDKEDLDYLSQEVLPHCSRVGCISDCGSPVFEDPGTKMLPLIKDFEVHRVPGVTSLGALMMAFPPAVTSFHVLPFLPQKKNDREKEWRRIQKQGEPVFLMETPYRIGSFLKEAQAKIPGWKMVFGYRLTQTGEAIFSGPVKEVAKKASGLEKGEFVALIYP